MRVIDYAPFVLEALASGELNQTALTEAVWGTSGRGNPKLTRSLFPYLERKGLIAVRRQGRAFMFSLTEAGKAQLAQNAGIEGGVK